MLVNYEVGRSAHICFPHDLTRPQQVGVSNNYSKYSWYNGGRPLAIFVIIAHIKTSLGYTLRYKKAWLEK